MSPAFAKASARSRRSSRLIARAEAEGKSHSHGEDPALRSIATAYLGQPALLIRTRLWWSFPAERVSDGDLHLAAQNHFHFDIDGWRTLKFFFYLTPTDDGAWRSTRDRSFDSRTSFTRSLSPRRSGRVSRCKEPVLEFVR